MSHELGPQTFTTLEEIENYLLANPNNRLRDKDGDVIRAIGDPPFVTYIMEDDSEYLPNKKYGPWTEVLNHEQDTDIDPEPFQKDLDAAAWDEDNPCFQEPGPEDLHAAPESMLEEMRAFSYQDAVVAALDELPQGNPCGEMHLPINDESGMVDFKAMRPVGETISVHRKQQELYDRTYARPEPIIFDDFTKMAAWLINNPGREVEDKNQLRIYFGPDNDNHYSFRYGAGQFVYINPETGPWKTISAKESIVRQQAEDLLKRLGISTSYKSTILTFLKELQTTK